MPHPLLRVILSALAILSVASAADSPSQKSAPTKTKNDQRKEFEARLFDAKSFASAVPADTVVYLPSSLPTYTDWLKLIKSHTSATLPNLAAEQLPPEIKEQDRDALSEIGVGQASVLVLVNSTGDVVRVFVCEAKPRSFGVDLAKTIFTWKYHPANVEGLPVPSISSWSINRSSASASTRRITVSDGDAFERVNTEALKQFTDAIYDAKQFAASLTGGILVHPATLVSNSSFQKGLKQLRQYTQVKFLAYPPSALPPKLQKGVGAIYPPELKKKEQSGEANVILLINSKGQVVKLFIADATDQQSAIAAAASLAKCTFTPAVVDGKAVPFLTMIPFKFSINM